MKLKLDFIQAFGMGYVAVDLVNPAIFRMRAKNTIPLISAAQNVTRSAYMDELLGVADVIEKFPDFTLSSGVQVTASGEEALFPDETLGELFSDQPLAEYVDAMRDYHHEESDHVASVRAGRDLEGGQAPPGLRISDALQSRLSALAGVAVLYQQVLNRLLAQHTQYVLLDNFPPTVKLFQDGLLKISEGGAENHEGQGDFTIHLYNVLAESEAPADGSLRVFPVKTLELELRDSITKHGVAEYAAEFRDVSE